MSEPPPQTADARCAPSLPRFAQVLCLCASLTLWNSGRSWRGECAAMSRLSLRVREAFEALSRVETREHETGERETQTGTVVWEDLYPRERPLVAKRRARKA